MPFDADSVRMNAREATTEDLLDRLTVYANGMEPEARDIFAAELCSRGISTEEIDVHHLRRRSETCQLPDGTAKPCSFCHRPAIAEGWDWHRLWRKIPLFPRCFAYCSDHLPAGHEKSTTDPDES